MTKVPVSAGGGLLDRSIFLKAAATSGLMIAGLANAAWEQRLPGTGLSKVGSLSVRSKALNRLDIASQPGTDGSGGSRTPLEHLEGRITPSRLHFERHHSGIPNLTADRYEMKIFGEVQRASAFNLEDLHRFAMISKVQFLECSGNSGALIAPEPVQTSCGSIHGLVSCSEWTGVPVSSLLDAVGVKPSAKWAIVDGADAGRMNRSIPLSKLYDDAIVALYQNGEPLRPENGYPARLFLPGWEGNTSIKWLRTFVLTDQPGYTREETSKYTDLYADGHADMFTFTMGVKSIITSTSLGMALGPKGRYQITGLAWSGLGGIKQVEV